MVHGMAMFRERSRDHADVSKSFGKQVHEPNAKDRQLVLNLLNDLGFENDTRTRNKDKTNSNDQTKTAPPNSVTKKSDGTIKKQKSFFRTLFPFLNQIEPLSDNEHDSNICPALREVPAVAIHKVLDNSMASYVKNNSGQPFSSISLAKEEDDNNFNLPLMSDLSVVDCFPIVGESKKGKVPSHINPDRASTCNEQTEKKRGKLPSILRNSPSQQSLSQDTIETMSSFEDCLDAERAIATEPVTNLFSKSQRHSCPHKLSASSLPGDEVVLPLRRTKSTGAARTTKIKFDNRVGVCEFIKSSEDIKKLTWWSPRELESFRNEALCRVKKQQLREQQQFHSNLIYAPHRAFFNHPAMRADADQEDMQEDLGNLAQSEFKSILVVDPHDMFLRLFTKCFRQMLPNVDVKTARSSDEALRLIQLNRRPPNKNQHYKIPLHGFDIIVTEERLQAHAYGRQKQQPSTKPQTGSALLKQLKLEEDKVKELWRAGKSGGGSHCRFSLFVGVTAHPRDDISKLEHSGADIVWGKPPPHMDENLRDKLLRTICKKRKLDIGCSS